MTRTLRFVSRHQIDFETAEPVPLQPGEVRLKTLYSGISAGTEITAYRGSNPYLHKAWDAGTRLFTAGPPTHAYPLSGWGYEEVGEVVEVAPDVEDVALGSRVYGIWGHRTDAVVSADYARSRQMPDGLDSLLGIFSRIGSIALNGLHDGRIRLGETVAVFGLGVLGQIVAQGARLSGARVIGVDLHPERLALARELGAHEVIEPARGSAAEQIKALTGGRGADVTFEVTGNAAALNEALRAAAYSSRVVAMGFIPGEARGLYLGEEFHHNRIALVCSQISGSDPEIQHRWNALRLAQTAIRLQKEGAWNLKPLISHVRPFEEAAALFKLLDEQPGNAMQAVLDFTGGP